MEVTTFVKRVVVFEIMISTFNLKVDRLLCLRSSLKNISTITLILKEVEYLLWLTTCFFDYLTRQKEDVLWDLFDGKTRYIWRNWSVRTRHWKWMKTKMNLTWFPFVVFFYFYFSFQSINIKREKDKKENTHTHNKNKTEHNKTM